MIYAPARTFVLASILLLASLHLFSAAEDSVKPKKPSTLNDTWFVGSEPERHHVIDTTIFHLEEYNFAQRNGIEYANMGVSGSAAYPLTYQMDRSTGFSTGYNQFDLYRYKKDSVRYYQVIRPYAELGMIIGMRGEQIFQGRFANQHKGIIYYGVDFTRISDKGAYVNQKTEDDGFNLYGMFNSKNKHWNVKADLLFNNYKVQENGGNALNPFDSSYFQKNLAPVILQAANNNYREINFYLTSSYNLGKKYYERKNDTLRIPVVMPLFKISHQFNIERNITKYSDLQPDSLTGFYGDFFRHDSVVNNTNYLKVGNAIQLEYHPRSLTSDSTYTEKDFIAYAEAGFDYYMLTQNSYKNNFSNLYVGGTFRNNYANRLKIIYRASVRYYLYGWNRNDFIADAVAGYDFGKYGVLTGNFTYQLKEAPYMFERFYFDSALSWSYNLPKTKVMNIGGKYQNWKYGIVADLNYYVADHLPVYPGYASPYLTGGEENVFVAHAGNRNQLVKGFHFDNDIWFTEAPNNGYIKQVYPMLYTKHSLYYERHVFKGFLWLDVGFDLRFRYQKDLPYYNPFLVGFYPAPYMGQKMFPVLDFFMNFKIKTVRIFLKVDNISSSFGPKGYFTSYLYPAADIAFKAGVKWRFFE
jgi:hypothetical protein